MLWEGLILKIKRTKLTDYISPKKYTFMPNTAGCFNSDDALRTLKLARDIGGWDMVKLEVLSDKKTLYPNMIETLKTAEKLVNNNFKVLAYCTDDPVLAKNLENVVLSYYALRLSYWIRARYYKSFKY